MMAFQDRYNRFLFSSCPNISLMNRIYIFFLLFSTSLSSRLKFRASVKENVELYHTITSLDQMLSANYHQSMEFLNINSPYTTYFLVDGQKLRTSRLIDREEFCRIKLIKPVDGSFSSSKTADSS